MKSINLITIRTVIFTYLILINVLVAQEAQVNSAFSRLGLGKISNSSLVSNMGMGGVSVGMNQPNQLNVVNPASYASLVFPVFDVGIQGTFQKSITENSQGNYSNLYIKNIGLGFKVSKRFGIGLGLMPFSNVGYNITQNFEEQNIGNITNNFEGTGGINKLFFGIGGKAINKDSLKLSFGAQINYLFGSNQYQSKMILPQGQNYYNSMVQEEIRVSDIGFNFGLNFEQKLNNIKYTIGANYGIGKNYSLKANRLVASYVINSSGFESIVDTINNVTNAKGQVYLPQYYGIGVSMELSKKVLLAADYISVTWSDFGFSTNNSITTEGELQDSWKTIFGLQYTPENDFRIKGFNSLFKLTQYRAGFSYNKSYLVVNNNNLNSWTVNFGLGVPLQKNQTRSRLNLAVEYGQNGNVDNNLVQENIWNLYIGLSLVPNWRERWFVKRKYD